MTIQELQSYASVAPQWTEACLAEHVRGESTDAPRQMRGRAPRAAVVQAEARTRPPTRSEHRVGYARVAGRVGPGIARETAPVRPTSIRQAAASRPGSPDQGALGRRVLARPTSTVRACHVQAPARAGVVDDVPTWVLAVIGITVGVLMLLALAFLGGPAYA